MLSVHLLISGFVQGVGFRHFVRKNAAGLGLKGWVRNLPNNKVEVIAQGSQESLDKLIELCQKGPFLSEVKNVGIKWEEAKETFLSFEIIV